MSALYNPASRRESFIISLRMNVMIRPGIWYLQQMLLIRQLIRQAVVNVQHMQQLLHILLMSAAMIQFI